jgi:hypothetical protein
MQPLCGIPDIGDVFAMRVLRPLDLLFLPGLWLSRFSSHFDRLWVKAVPLARPMLAVTVVFLIFCSLGLSQPSARPDTGTYIKDMDRSGYGVLIVHNNWTMDTVAVLTDRKVKPLLAVYLRSMDTLKITGIEDGEYGLYFTIGNLWDAKAGKFRSVLGYYRYNQPLNEAGASNFLPDQFQFPDLRS